jgi:uncharacterized membrane protein YedE/YeeE
MKKTNVAAFAAGLLFAVGLGLAEMTRPAKVIAFLDVTGAWDPSLAFVMIGAIAVHVFFARRARKTLAPRFARAFLVPTEGSIDRRLLAGAALFGLGWGAAGFCPGPALVSTVTLSRGSLTFVAAMLAGMLAHVLTLERARAPEEGAASRDEFAS